MKKLALLLSLVFVAGTAFAQEPAKPADKTAPAPQAEKATVKHAAPAMKHHEVKGLEVVSVDVEKKTMTVKGDKENMTMPVDAKAAASLKTLKAGEKVDVICMDNEKGEHQAVTKIMVPKAPAKTEKAPEKAPEKK